MHADDSHNNKPGFFSKIFGHDDPAPVADPVAAPVEAEVTPAPVADSAAAPEPVQPMFADVELQPGTMSDVHATPGATETLDLSASSVTQPESATDASETFELPDIKAAQDTTNPTVDVVMPDTAADESKDEIVFDSTAAQPAPSETPEPVATPELAEGTPSVETPEAIPPAPPVAEGEAWAANQAAPDAASSTEVAAEESTGGSQAGLADAQSDISTILSTHKDMTVPEPGAGEPSPLEPVSVPDVIPTIASPLEESGKVSTQASEPESSEPANGSQRAAAVARLQGHIDELETSLQKVRNELDALK